MFYFVNDLNSGKLVGKYTDVPPINIPNIVLEIVNDEMERFEKIEDVTSQLTGYSDAITSLAISPDNNIIVSGGDKPVINLWDISNETKIKSFSYISYNNSGFRSVNFSPDGRYLVAVSNSKTVIVWNLVTEEVIYHRHTDGILYKPNGNAVSANDSKLAIFSQDGKYLAMGGGNLSIVEFLPDDKTNNFIEIPYMLYNDYFPELGEDGDIFSRA